MSKPHITAERLRELVHYDPDTGIFTRLSGRRGPIGWRTNKEGHLRADVDKRPYLLHRLAFLYMTGLVPEHEVDHINRDPSDNRWVNLRAATRRQNSFNRKVNSTSTIGLKGIYRQKDCNRWKAEIYVSGRKIYLGLFKSADDAHAAYAKASVIHHGEFGCTA